MNEALDSIGAPTPDSLARYLADRFGAALPKVTFSATPGTSGFSGGTVLFDLDFTDAAQPPGAYVLKTPPIDDPHPLFPSYDLARQVAAMRLVDAATEAPVPGVLCWESDPGPLGTPFVVMERVDGDVPADVPPYTFGGWMHEVGSDGRRQLERSFVGALAALHASDLAGRDVSALELDTVGATPLRRHVSHQRSYYDWIRGDRRFPVVEGAFRWLEERWPTTESQTGIVWGDARLANAMFRDGEVVALLDWESATIGPPEIDLAWAVYFRDYFQRVAERHGYAGLPDFMPAGRVVAEYEHLSGREPRDLGWHLVYATLRQALTAIRVTERMVLRGQLDAPRDQQDLIPDRGFLESLLAGATPNDLTDRSS